MKNIAVVVFFVCFTYGRIATADFSLSHIAEPLNDGSGNWRINLYLRNDGTLGTGTRVFELDSMSLTDTTAGHRLVVGFVSGAPDADADLLGVAAPDPYHSDRSFLNLLGDPGGSESDPRHFFALDIEPTPTHANYAGGATSFSVTGTTDPGAVPLGVDADTANGGRGALYGVAVVPFGDTVHVRGGIMTDTFAEASLNFDIQVVPEPASALAVVAGAVLLLARRR